MILLTPYLYVVYKWMVDLRHGTRLVRWNTRFAEPVLVILLHMVLTIVTAGIYYPAAVLLLYRYFASKTEVVSENGSRKSFRFDGNLWRGFLLMWGQILLTIVTLGVYAPWGTCTVWAWLSEKTCLRD
jgi:uncharacterized membrane protein YjgN (DUF898 family)